MKLIVNNFESTYFRTVQIAASTALVLPIHTEILAIPRNDAIC